MCPTSRVGIYYTIRQYAHWKKTPTVPNHGLNLQSTVTNVRRDQSTWLYLSIFLCASFIIVLLLVVVLRKRIRIAIALTKEGSRAVSTVFFPIFSWILYIVAITFAIGVGLYLGSIGQSSSYRMVQRVTANGEPTNEQCRCDGLAINYTIGSGCDPQIFHLQF